MAGGMKQNEWERADAVSPEFASLVNLLAHPMAGAAAAGAIGLGLASHAFGLWVGALTGAAEASQKLLSGAADAEPRQAARKPVRLRLVETTPASQAAAAATRTAVADAQIVARNVVKSAQKATAAALDDAAAIAKPAAKAASVPSGLRGMAKPETPDDLKAISGVGPKLEKVLNGFGVWTYGQIAQLNAAEIAWLDDHLGFSGRITRDDWVGQARSLASGEKGGR